ncbi:hypothetical protein [Plantactinospora sp. BB1]|uniref:hypothetical protein n=1 Tax=Plantactinospora sp. BB1 TaxID=2071627 RepID=UPI000D17C0A6|nr:hypothetical protein [Plantactinospora sp. BB1]AVT40223.1 hypothetical protein C6W10_31495 [Plantactinospora sp. BB1]
MGYTHYFSYRPRSPSFLAAWPRMRADAERILDRVATAGVRLCRDPFEGTLPPEYEVIAVNGDREREESCEPLVLAPRWPGYRQERADGRVTGFCKTGRHPYDLAVSAILLRCHRLLPDGFAIHSDGGWDAEWRDGRRGPHPVLPSARDLVAELFGDEVSSCPFDRERVFGPPVRN